MAAARRKRYLLLLAVLVLSIGCDQASKEIATRHLRDTGIVSMWGDTVRVLYAENTGAFLGLGESWPDWARFWLLGVMTAVFLIVVLVLLLRRTEMGAWAYACLALLLAGGIGNAIDRLRVGFVVDFMNVGVGSVRTGIFNVADVCITVGALGLLFAGGGEAEPVVEGELEAEA
jgi:signal peptidase II